MDAIQLYNTATRRKEALEPLDPQNVRMYLCGPTVYDRAHLGNARPVLVFDVLYRLLRHRYPQANVTYVRNFTDVDDRINETALKRREAGAEGALETLIRERSNETIQWYHEDMDALGALRPTHEPRATEYIAQMIAMCEDLIAKGHAYAAEGHVLFAVESYSEYGKLSGRSVDDMIAGARVEVAPYKRNPMDFVLWKPSDDELPGWDSPWGRGRPGWHIECSAMAAELLGDSFDIHGGGIDLQFPHHENEIAQSRCAGHGFAQIWMHNEMLQVEGKKMSKSLGNFFTVRDLLDQGVSGEVIRFVMLSTHYRKPMDWTEKKREEVEKCLLAWKKIIDEERDAVSAAFTGKAPPDEIIRALSEDLNTPQAIAELHKLAKSAKQDLEAKIALAEGLAFFGFDYRNDWSVAFGSSLDRILGAPIDLGPYEDMLFEARKKAKETKDFGEVDRITQLFLGAGLAVRVSPERVEMDFTEHFDPEKLDLLN
ncbi:cysteine--tRNA ligase [Actibacterium sp. 188UL27-1]|uniref:cysteine--tRNA ligase n=1 Tax=Actibacterium sp. 188UL27-1 TaxID=2786961 RepID=UPI00195E4B4C|nr:cysteine--tRNA ligase [Actibacterium sp. 188UL27-1]MBM7067323.1 cysteine--tRNA ligase [Actibacterium sp. 188UL27-1]